jgi:uncharacterized membrane protein
VTGMDRATEPSGVVRGPLPTGAAVMAAVLGVSGALHLSRPAVYRRLVPPVLGNPTAVVYASGVAELVCAVALVTRQRWAPVASAVLLLAVWPGNWQMAWDVQRDPAAHPAVKALLWARLPAQLPMIKAVLAAGGTGGPSTTSAVVDKDECALRQNGRVGREGLPA